MGCVAAARSCSVLLVGVRLLTLANLSPGILCLATAFCPSDLVSSRPPLPVPACQHLADSATLGQGRSCYLLMSSPTMQGAEGCGACGTVNSRKRCCRCRECDTLYHLTCVGLTRAQADAIPHWSCASCRGVAGGNAPAATLSVDLVELLSDLKHPVLPRVPKGAVHCVAEALHKLLDRAMESRQLRNWVRLLSFGSLALRRPDTESSHGASLATKVKRQVSEFLDSAVLPVLPTPMPVGQRNVLDDSVRLGKRVTAKFNDGDIRGAVRLITSEENHAPSDDRTRRLLLDKHPPAPNDSQLPPPPDTNLATPVVAGEDDVRKALASFGPGASGGPGGLRPGHLVTLTARGAGEAGARLLASLTKFTNLLLRGEVPEFARQVFYGARLCALGKKDGGVRPIAAGNVLRRLAAKVGARPSSARLGSELRPIQLGFSTRGGCEAAVHAARSYLSGTSQRRVVCKLDVANAFNSLRRDALLTVARRRVPELYPFIWQAYSGDSILFFEGGNLVSATGVQQGDPLGPALFSLAIDEAVQEINTELNVWYLDDGTLGGEPENVCSNVRSLVGRLGELGLKVNSEKCELLTLHHSANEERETLDMFRGVLPRIRLVPVTEATLLGAPLSEEGVDAALRSGQQKLERMVSRLELVEGHQGFTLLRNCLAIPKLQHVLRTSPTYKRRAALVGFDKVLVDALSTVTNVRFESSPLVQAVLPVSVGGLGVRRASDVALPAFISSLHSTSELVEAVLLNVNHLAVDHELELAEGEWTRRVGGASLAEGVDKCRQRTWDLPLAEFTRDQLLNAADQVSRARILASSCKESGLWLQALPVPSLGTLLDSETFRIAVALRVGADVCEPHKCRCGRMMDSRGLHGLSCRFSAGRHPRHSALNDIIRRSLLSAGIPSVLEPVGTDRGDGRRPDGTTVFPFSRGKSLCWDATCVDTFAETNLNGSALASGGAACRAEESKRRKYAALADRFRFEPIAVETSGVFGTSTASVVTELGRRITGVTGEPRETLWLKQRIGLAVQRGNAFSISAAALGGGLGCEHSPS